MTNTQSFNNSEERILKRIYILSNIENIINESSYYRTHSSSFKGDKIIIGNINNSELIAKIL